MHKFIVVAQGLEHLDASVDVARNRPLAASGSSSRSTSCRWPVLDGRLGDRRNGGDLCRWIRRRCSILPPGTRLPTSREQHRLLTSINAARAMEGVSALALSEPVCPPCRFLSRSCRCERGTYLAEDWRRCLHVAQLNTVAQQGANAVPIHLSDVVERGVS